MMKFKKIALVGFSASLVVVGATALALQKKQTFAQVNADIDVTDYVPVCTENFTSGEFNIAEQISYYHETFFDPARHFGTTRPFINTINSTGRDMHESRTGDIRSQVFNQTGEYISFVMGGNGTTLDGQGHPLNFVNVWDEQRGYNVAEYIANTAFQDADISCNMVFKYVQVPSDHRGRTLIYIHDGSTGSFGGVTFGELRINQTWDEVVESFSAHLATYALSCNNAANESAYSKIKKLYEEDSYYAALRTSLAAKTSADDGFEKKNGLNNWAFDRTNSSDVVDFNTVISDNGYKSDDYFSVPMPANKTGDRYINADASGIAENQKYRIVSSEFTLSGRGLISAKLGGGTAVLELLDDEYNVLETTSTGATGENPILNPAFVGDTGEQRFNIVESGVRLNTMSRVYLDCTEHLGKRVRVALSDARTGNGWGLAYFDEVKTYYPTNEGLSFKLDKITQTKDENNVYYGVVTDKYVGPANTDFGKAYAFVTSFYETMRDPAHGASWCTVKENQDVVDLVDAYEDLTSAVKAIVDASQDYNYGKNLTSANWYRSQPDTTTYTIGATMAYVVNGEAAPLSNPSPSTRTFGFGGANSTAMIVVISSFIVIAFAFIVIMTINKKRKSRKQ